MPQFYTNFGIGTAAFVDTGVDEGDVPLLLSGGVFDEAVIPADITRDTELQPFVDNVLSSAVTGNVETGIAVSWDAVGRKLNFVVQGIPVETTSELTGDGTTTDPLGISNHSITEPKLLVGNTPQNEQVLSWDAANNRLLWKNDETAPPGSGLTAVAHDTAFTGDGTAGSPIALDITGTEFPTIPILKGGTGATDEANARSNLGLGTAAEQNVGVANGDVLQLGAGGIVDVGRLAAGGADGHVLTRTATGQAWEVTTGGTITGVTAGAGLEGGGTAGDVSLNIGDNAVTEAMLAVLNDPATGQVLTWDGATLSWAATVAGYTDADVDARVLDRLQNAPQSNLGFFDRLLLWDDGNPNELRVTNIGGIRLYTTANWAQPTNTTNFIPAGTLATSGTTGQVLTRTAGGQAWEDATGMGGGLLTVASDATLSGDGTSLDPLGIADDSITEPKLAASNAPGTNQVLGWDGTALEWVAQTGGGGLTVSAWDNATTYNIGNIVTQNSRAFLSRVDSNIGNDPDLEASAVNWFLIRTGEEILHTPGRFYAPGTVVNSTGLRRDVFICRRPTTDTPSEFDADWFHLPRGAVLLEATTTASEYRSGTLVYVGDDIYFCHTSVVPPGITAAQIPSPRQLFMAVTDLLEDSPCSYHAQLT